MTGPVGADGRVRVVVTGMGCISPVGNDRPSTWAALCEGRSGIAPITLFDPTGLPSRIIGEVKGFDAVAVFGAKEVRRTSRPVLLGIVAAREAVADSGLDIGPIADDVAVIVASGIGGMEVLERASVNFHERGHKAVSAYTAMAMLVDMPAGMIATDTGARGPNFAIVSACASGSHAIGEAAEQIRRGDAVAALAGGTEAAICGVGMAAFGVMGALSRRNDEPERASRPFDVDRDGFVAAEGAAVVVLEEREHARARGADGRGSRRCMERTLARARCSPADVDYVNAHGTGTPLNDVAETLAMHAVFGDHAGRVPISSTKSMTGHLLGAAGALEAIVAVMAVHDGFVPPTINLDNPDPRCDLDHVPHTGRRLPVGLALSTSFGFGGHNACLAFAAPDRL